jgi:hypothetical protein
VIVAHVMEIPVERRCVGIKREPRPRLRLLLWREGVRRVRYRGHHAEWAGQSDLPLEPRVGAPPLTGRQQRRSVTANCSRRRAARPARAATSICDRYGSHLLQRVATWWHVESVGRKGGSITGVSRSATRTPNLLGPARRANGDRPRLRVSIARGEISSVWPGA